MAAELRDFQDAQREDERRRAVRALLRRPLLTPGDADYRLVRRHQGWLADWFARETGWTLHADTAVARLRKVPARHADGTRAAQVKGKVPFSRRRYVLACLALAALERAESQVTLGWLAERLLAFARDPELAEAGMTFTLGTREERADLAAVAGLLIATGVLAKVAGDESAYVSGSGDALYDVHRRVLAVLLATRRGPSTVTATALEERLAAITEELVPDTEDGHNRMIRHSLTRRLLDDPVLYYRELTEAERAYLERQRGPMLKRITEATGFVAEVRAEGIALLDPTREATDLGMPEEGTDGHATLLLAEHLAAGLRACPGEPVELDDLRAHMERTAEQYRTLWRKTATVPELTAGAVHRLEALGLIRLRGTTVVPLPALARFGFGEPVISGSRNSET
ncbi:TIGR02678 family protein [Thermoactinospora rubra]|uniref:TIGR02678 family protein n=1 Tax=Thermoactinospora rubra TaxID=1088767 RepID=UPI000A0FF0CB|nr:TIGR02678 family protein [Thermoactinospora rubra]